MAERTFTLTDKSWLSKGHAVAFVRVDSGEIVAVKLDSCSSAIRKRVECDANELNRSTALSACARGHTGGCKSVGLLVHAQQRSKPSPK